MNTKVTIEPGERVPPLHVLGDWDNEKELPGTAEYERYNAWNWRGNLWIKLSEGQWTELVPGKSHFLGIPKEEDHGPEVCNEELNRMLLMATAPEDKGAMARELMERRLEVKRLRRKRIIDLVIIWSIILGAIGGTGYLGYLYAMDNYKTGRYSDERACKVDVGDLVVTGKRTYSYPYQSLFGWRWVDESKVEETTTLNIPNVKFQVVGDAEPKFWGFRFDGERGTQILKPAKKYYFTWDKGIALTTYGGFCQPAPKQQASDDPKNVERAIID